MNGANKWNKRWPSEAALTVAEAAKGGSTELSAQDALLNTYRLRLDGCKCGTIST